jgi:hypothetical protein
MLKPYKAIMRLILLTHEVAFPLRRDRRRLARTKRVAIVSVNILLFQKVLTDKTSVATEAQ